MQGGKFLWVALVLALCLLVAGGAFMMGQSRSAVDWTRVRAVAMESDDWGLPGFSPSLEAWQGIERAALAPGHFPDVYWHSTLENAATVRDMSRLMLRYRGQDGLPAVFQPNYVTGSMEWIPGPGGGSWRRYDWPELAPAYARPGLLTAVHEALGAGTWYPELHARWHYDPAMRQENSMRDATAKLAAARGILLFPDSEKARELGPWRSRADLASELDASLKVFSLAFGRFPASVIAPDYTWNTSLEDLWDSRGLRVIQAKREQRNPQLGYGLPGRLKKFVARRWSALRYPDRIFLERNVRLEPVQALDPDAVVRRALEQTNSAWSANQPAIVESHRVNFAHLDPKVSSLGINALSDFLAGITSQSDHLPIFLTDVEIAGLQARGVSWVQRGPFLILRNATHGSRMVAVPRSVNFPGRPPAHGGGQHLLKLPALTTVVLNREGEWRTCSFER